MIVFRTRIIIVANSSPNSKQTLCSADIVIGDQTFALNNGIHIPTFVVFPFRDQLLRCPFPASHLSILSFFCSAVIHFGSAFFLALHFIYSYLLSLIHLRTRTCQVFLLHLYYFRFRMILNEFYVICG